MNLSKLDDHFKQKRPDLRFIYVSGKAHLLHNTWLFVVRDYYTREVLIWDFGHLPAYYDGLKWSGEVAALYALVKASRAIDVHLKDCRVVRYLPGRKRQNQQAGKGRKWAA